MFADYRKRAFLITVGAVLISIISSNVHASYKQWPLRGKGEVRYLKFIKVYDIGLYSPSNIDATNILDSNISKCLKLDYAVSLTIDQFRLATKTVLKRQHSSKYLQTIKQPLEALQNAYKDVKSGDHFTFCYNGKSKIVNLGLNDKSLIEIKSAELAKAYLGMWLSNNQPVSIPLYNSFFVKK